MNKQILWLSRDTTLNFIEIRREEPRKGGEGNFRGGKLVFSFCGSEFLELCPSLEIRKGTKCRVRLTNLKNGIKLEKIK